MDRRAFFRKSVGAIGGAGVAASSTAVARTPRPTLLESACEVLSRRSVIPDSLGPFLDGADVRAVGHGGRRPATLPTGFEDLDRITGGLRRGSITAIAGRPAMGKSTLALDIATHLAMDHGVPVAYFSAPRSNWQVMASVLASRFGFDRNTMWPRFHYLDGLQRVLADETGLHIDDRPLLTPREVRTLLEDLTQTAGSSPTVIVVDRPEMLCVGTNETSDRERMAEAMAALHAIARDFDSAVLVTTEVGRRAERRRDKRPRITDLPYEAVPIAVVANVVMLIYRDEVYNLDSPEAGTAQIEIARNSDGPTGTVRLSFRPQACRFENFDWERSGATEDISCDAGRDRTMNDRTEGAHTADDLDGMSSRCLAR